MKTIDIDKTISKYTSSISFSRWINITKDIPKKSGVTRYELAKALDDLVGIENHCTGKKSIDSHNPNDNTIKEHLQEKITNECQDFLEKLNSGENCSLSSRAGFPKKKKFIFIVLTKM